MLNLNEIKIIHDLNQKDIEQLIQDKLKQYVKCLSTFINYLQDDIPRIINEVKRFKRYSERYDLIIPNPNDSTDFDQTTIEEARGRMLCEQNRTYQTIKARIQIRWPDEFGQCIKLYNEFNQLIPMIKALYPGSKLLTGKPDQKPMNYYTDESFTILFYYKIFFVNVEMKFNRMEPSNGITITDFMESLSISDDFKYITNRLFLFCSFIY